MAEDRRGDHARTREQVHQMDIFMHRAGERLVSSRHGLGEGQQRGCRRPEHPQIDRCRRNASQHTGPQAGLGLRRLERRHRPGRHQPLDILPHHVGHHDHQRAQPDRMEQDEILLLRPHGHAAGQGQLERGRQRQKRDRGRRGVSIEIHWSGPNQLLFPARQAATASAGISPEDLPTEDLSVKRGAVSPCGPTVIGVSKVSPGRPNRTMILSFQDGAFHRSRPRNQYSQNKTLMGLFARSLNVTPSNGTLTGVSCRRLWVIP